MITDGDDCGEHGPKFVSIMDGINAKANTNITLSHHFNDEVDYHQNLNKQKPNQTYKQKVKESKIKSLIM
jgi:peptide methionine sulfoxide reductase MsrA